MGMYYAPMVGIEIPDASMYATLDTAYQVITQEYVSHQGYGLDHNRVAGLVSILENWEKRHVLLNY